MKVVRWSFNNLHVPMIRDNNGDLWCTSKQLSEALQITASGLRSLVQRHKNELDSLSVAKQDAKEFLLGHKVEFGITRVKKDLTIWSEQEMILVAIISKSPVSKEFRRGLVGWIKKQAVVGWVPSEEYNKLLMEFGKLAVRQENLERLLTPNKRLHLQVVQ